MTDHDPAVPHRLSRRAVLLGGAAAGAVAHLEGQAFARTLIKRATTSALAAFLQHPPSFSQVLRRREDQLLIRVSAYNLRRSGQVLQPIVAIEPAALVIGFGPQALAEVALDAGDLDAARLPSRSAGPSHLAFTVPAGQAIDLRAATLLDWRGLRLAVVPAADDIPDDSPAAPPATRRPRAQETRLELPWRLLVSPRSDVAFVHDLPETRDGVTSLWHVRAAVRRPVRPSLGDSRLLGPPDEFADGLTLRALAQTDPAGREGETANDVAGISPLTPKDRRDLVALTTGGARRPIPAERLWLSPLGGWLDVDGSWPTPPPGGDLVGWEQQIAQGRDQRVQVLRAGFLFPFGHRATEVELVERRYEPGGGSSRAVLRRRRFVIIGQRTKTYDAVGTPGMVQGGRGWPFTTVQFTDKVTADFNPTALEGTGPDVGRAFLGRVSDGPLLLDVTMTDRDGQVVRTAVPLVFVLRSTAFPGDAASELDGPDEPDRDGVDRIPAIIAGYNADGGPGVPRDLPLAGQRVALARSNRPGDTSVDITRMRIQAVLPTLDRPALDAAGQAPFHPVMEEADIRIPATAQVTPPATDADFTAATFPDPTVVLDTTYLEVGFDDVAMMAQKNVAGVFATTKAYKAAKDAGTLTSFLPDQLPVPPELAGGLINPASALTGLSRELGIAAGDLGALKGELLDGLGGLTDLDLGAFNPLSFLGADAKLLGGITLADIIKAIDLPIPTLPTLPDLPDLPDAGDIPETAEFVEGPLRIVTRRIGPPPVVQQPPTDLPPGVDLPPVAIPQPPTAIETLIDFVPPRSALQPDPLGVFQPKLDADGDVIAALVVKGRSYVDLTGAGGSTAEVVGTLTDFAISLFGDGAFRFIEIAFNQLRFETRTGSKVVLDPDIAEVRFAGPLEFVNELRNFLKPACIVPGVEITPIGVKAAYDLELPAIGVGIFSLSNVRLAAGFELPFATGAARATFAFSTPDDPFALAISIFGGGGYVTLAVGTNGLQEVTISLEFGAMTSFSAVVATGSLSLTAGISFSVAEEVIDGESGLAVTLTGFVKLRGEVTVLGLVSASILLEISVAYESATNSVLGRGILVLEVDLLLVSERFEIEVEKRFGGSGEGATAGEVQGASFAQAGLPTGRPTFASQVDARQWGTYVDAFAGDVT